MNGIAISFRRKVFLLFVFMPFLLLSSCEQYDYSNPGAGLIQITLRAEYSQFDTSFALNSFTIATHDVYALRADGARADVFLEPGWIRPPTASGWEGVPHNTLGRNAYDSTDVVGLYPIPPGKYVGLTLYAVPTPKGNTIVILDGYRRIRVQVPTDSSSLGGNNPEVVTLHADFEIREARTTELTMTVNLDSTLARHAYSFQYTPSYRISSIRYR